MPVTTVMLAVAVCVLPGFSLGVVSGLRLAWSLGAAIPLTFALYGFTAWLTGAIEVRFSLLSLAIGWVSALLLAGAWRMLQRRCRHGRGPGSDAPDGGYRDPRWLLPAAGAAVGAGIILQRASDSMGSVPHQLMNITQGWDAQWHASVVRYIMDEGIASPVLMGTLQNQETQSQEYYPTAWHAGAALLGELGGYQPIEAMNVMACVLPALLFPASAAVLAWRLVGNRGLTAQLGALFAGLAVFGIPSLYWVGVYVGMWPYLAAMGMAGLTAALFMAVPYRPEAAFAAGLALLGVMQTHPAPVSVVVLLVGLWWLTAVLWRPAVSRVRDFCWLFGAGIVGTVLLVPQIIVGSETADAVQSFSAGEDATRANSFLRIIMMETRHVEEWSGWTGQWFVYGGALGVAVVLLVWRRGWWLPASWLVSVLVGAHAFLPFAGLPGKALSAVAELHYSTPHRLVMPVALCTAAAAGVGAAAVLRAVTLAPWRRWARWSTVASLVLAVPAAVGGVCYLSAKVDGGARWAIESPRDDSRMVSDVDLRAFEWLAQQPRAYDGHIFGDPSDGHGWMYAYNGLPSLARHYYFPEMAPDTDTLMLFWHTWMLGVGNWGVSGVANNVDAAARNLGVSYIVLSPGVFWEIEPERGLEVNPVMDPGLWYTPGVTPIWHEENVTIFAVNQAFTDEELTHFVDSGESPEELPAQEHDGQGNYVFPRPEVADMGPDADYTEALRTGEPAW